MGRDNNQAITLAPIKKSTENCEHAPSDEAPLLGQQEEVELSGESRQTPLPVLQVSIVILLRTIVPICLQVIYPFINEHVAALPNSPARGDSAKVGYYVGIIEGIFMVCMCLISLPFGRAADKFGRKRMLLFGLVGATISTFAFGFAPTLSTMILIRAAGGLSNGSVGVLRTVMAEITDSSNRSFAFSLFPLAFAVGTSISAFTGGQFYPSGQQAKFPAMPPCTIAAGFTAFGFLFAAIFLKETLKGRIGETGQDQAQVEQASLGSLLTPNLNRLLLNYAFISFLNAALITLFPLFAFTPVDAFGLSWSTKRIGTVMALQSIPICVIQLALFPSVHKRIGSVALYRRVIPTFPLIFAILPLTSLAKRSFSGIVGDFLVWTGVLIFTLLNAFADWTFTTLVLAINSEASNGGSLGAVNGIAITVNTGFRAIAPPFASILFAFGIARPSILFGQLIWFILVALSVLSCLAARHLPEET